MRTAWIPLLVAAAVSRPIAVDAGHCVTQVVWSADFSGGDNGGFATAVSGSGSVAFSSEAMTVDDPDGTAGIALAQRDWTYATHGPDGRYTLLRCTLVYRATLLNTYGTSGWNGFRVGHLTEAANAAYLPIQLSVTGWANKLDFAGVISGPDLFTADLNAAYTYTISHDVQECLARVEITHPTKTDYDSGWVAAPEKPATRLRLGTTINQGKGRTTFDTFTLTAIYAVDPGRSVLIIR